MEAKLDIVEERKGEVVIRCRECGELRELKNHVLHISSGYCEPCVKKRKLVRERNRKKKRRQPAVAKNWYVVGGSWPGANRNPDFASKFAHPDIKEIASAGFWPTDTIIYNKLSKNYYSIKGELYERQQLVRVTPQNASR